MSESNLNFQFILEQLKRYQDYFTAARTLDCQVVRHGDVIEENPLFPVITYLEQHSQQARSEPNAESFAFATQLINLLEDNLAPEIAYIRPTSVLNVARCIKSPSLVHRFIRRHLAALKTLKPTKLQHDDVIILHYIRDTVTYTTPNDYTYLSTLDHLIDTYYLDKPDYF